MEQQKFEEFQAICRRNGWKCTSQRLAVYEFVHENYTHPGVDDVWRHVRQSLPAVTRESVYRILNELAGQGVIQKLNHLDSARYDCQTGPQGHFICEICGEITDFAFPEGALAPADPPCGEVRHIELRLSGVCGKCRQAMTEGKPGKEKQVRIRARKTRK